MAHFYGSVQGHRGEATRLGTEKSGMSVYAASWDGRIEVELRVRNGVDWATVRLARHHGAGTDRPLYDGPVSGELPKNDKAA